MAARARSVGGRLRIAASRPTGVDVVELVRDVRAVYAGGTAFESRSADVMLRSLTGAPADGHGLTEREREVTWLVAQGLSNRVIGEQLFISQSTVKFHLNNIMVKLGVSRRAGLVYVAGKQALLRRRPATGRGQRPALGRGQRPWHLNDWRG